MILACDVSHPLNGQQTPYVVEWFKFGVPIPFFINFRFYPPHVDPEYAGEHTHTHTHTHARTQHRGKGGSRTPRIDTPNQLTLFTFTTSGSSLLAAQTQHKGLKCESKRPSKSHNILIPWCFMESAGDTEKNRGTNTNA